LAWLAGWGKSQSTGIGLFYIDKGVWERMSEEGRKEAPIEIWVSNKWVSLISYLLSINM
jgi:hypothetical protein